MPKFDMFSCIVPTRRGPSQNCNVVIESHFFPEVVFMGLECDELLQCCIAFIGSCSTAAC